MKKRISSFIIILTLLLGLSGFGQTVYAATGKTSIAVSSGTLNIGDTLTVTVRATTSSGGTAIATMTLSYDASILEFVSCSASTYGGGGGSVTVPTDSFSVQLKAVSAGNASLVLSASDGVDFSSNEELESMEGSSTVVTVKNAASENGGSSNAGNNAGGGENSNTGGNTNSGGSSNENGSTAVLSADNSLKTLTISSGTLSPAFSGSTVNYTATVANDVTTLAINAVPVNKNATVESVSGNTNLAVGTNQVKIVVKAENGTTATYTIKVTRLAADQTAQETPAETPAEEPEAPAEPETTAETIQVGSVSYQVADAVPEEIIPPDFTVMTVNYHGNIYQGLGFNQGTMTLLYLVETPDGNGKLFVYDETRDTFYDFVRMSCGGNYVIAMLSPVDYAVPENYTQTSFQAMDGGIVSAYQMISEDTNEQDFYLFYGVNQDGTEGLYQYDSLEGTYQRAVFVLTGETSENTMDEYVNLQEQYNELIDKYKEVRSSSVNTIAILGFVTVLLIIVIINLIFFGWNKLKSDKIMDDRDMADADEDEEDDDSDELEPKRRRSWNRSISKPEMDVDASVGKKTEKDKEKQKKLNEIAEKSKKKKKPGEEKDKKEIDVIDFNDL